MLKKVIGHWLLWGRENISSLSKPLPGKPLIMQSTSDKGLRSCFFVTDPPPLQTYQKEQRAVFILGTVQNALLWQSTSLKSLMLCLRMLKEHSWLECGRRKVVHAEIVTGVESVLKLICANCEKEGGEKELAGEVWSGSFWVWLFKVIFGGFVTIWGSWSFCFQVYSETPSESSSLYFFLPLHGILLPVSFSECPAFQNFWGTLAKRGREAHVRYLELGQICSPMRVSPLSSVGLPSN